MSLREQYYQASVTPNDPDRFMTPTLNLLCTPSQLKQKVVDLERDEKLKVTKVLRLFNGGVRELPQEDWR
jgi:hypothetical protein